MPTGVPSRVSDAELMEAFNGDDPIRACLSQLGCTYATLRDGWVRLFGEEACRKRSARLRSAVTRGERNPMFGGTGYVLEHQAVYAKSHGLTELPDGVHIHHKNGNKLDNRPDNLEMLSASEHMALHNRMRFGDPVPAR